MRKKILLPTDFSENSWNAIVYAITMYKNVRCDFYILNVFFTTGYALESMMIPEPGEKVYEAEREKSESGLARILERLVDITDNPNHEFYLLSEFNSVLEAIKNTVAKKDIEMIVMGTKGDSDITNLIYGSNTVDIMERVTDCPVLAIPNSARYRSPKEIVFPTNYRTSFKRKEFQHLIEIIKMSNAVLKVLYVAEDDELSAEQLQNKELLEQSLEGLPYSFHNLHHPDVKSGLNCFVESRGSDLVTFVNHKHGFFEGLFSKPLVKDLGYRSKVPVLTLHG